MFTMHQHPYVYPAPLPPPRQYSTGHGTSSAFSSSANPDEDWTKISDLAERRRIQNRIAQRNYRKKLKKKMEELERRASDGSETAEKQLQPTTKAKKQPSTQKSQKATHPRQPSVRTGQFTPPTQHEDLLFIPTTTYDERERSRTPPLYSYTNGYSTPDLTIPQYGSVHQYPATTTTADTYPGYLPSGVPVTLPSMANFNDSLKREAYPSEESILSYSPYLVPGIDVSSPPSYDGNPHTPPLSHHSYEPSGSDSGYPEYPTTPLSMPSSPGLAHH